MIEAGILGEEAIEHGAEEKYAGAFERLLVNRDGDLDSACDPDAAALADAPHDGPAIDVTDSTDAALGGAIGHLGKKRKDFPNRLGVPSGTSIHQTEVVRR